MLDLKGAKMRRKLLPLLILLAGCAANPADNLPAAQVSSSSPSPSAPAGGSATPDAPAVSLPLDGKAGLVGFVGSKVTGKHEGSFKDYAGTIKLVDNNPEKSSVEVEIQIKSLVTDDPDLTEHLQSEDFFEMGKFPTAKFVSSSITKKDQTYQVTGSLTMHGVTKTIAFPAKIEASKDQVQVKAEFVIDRFDFDMKYKGKADNLIRKEVVIQLDLKAKKS